MNFCFESLSKSSYRVTHPEQIVTPRLLLFRERLEQNIITMRRLLHEINPNYGLEMLCPHVKTHKSLWVTQRLMEAGISFFKATPNEVDMLARAEAKRIFVAYPLVQSAAQKLARIAAEHRDIRWYVQIARPLHAEYLLSTAKQHDLQWDFFIDLDVGMQRTGIQPKDALTLCHTLRKEKLLRFAGLHAYDGHNHSVDPKQRSQEAAKSMSMVVETVRAFEHENIRVPSVVVGGTPSFLPDWEYLNKANLDSKVFLSPGTWVFFDTNYHRILPQTFDVAALILAQVMDKVSEDTATLNLGHKRWSVDQGPVESFSLPGMQAKQWNEEHTVVSVPPESGVRIGDYVLIAPKHVCSTTNLWEFFTIIDANGEIEVEECPIDARNK